MELKAQIFTATVMHKRLFPKVNRFLYKVYYLAFPISKLYAKETTKNLAINRFSLLSFYEKDHGTINGKIEPWIRNILKKYSLSKLSNEIILITMPRIIGYVFNPVSFWFCLDKKKELRAVLSEINNTFGETHSYLCFKEKNEVINSVDWIEAKKLFHISPFLKREGHYKFRFALKENKLSILINFYNKENKQQLITSLNGTLKPLTKFALIKMFFKYPLITFKVIYLIHYQALKLVLKSIKYIPKPKQLAYKISSAKKIKNS